MKTIRAIPCFILLPVLLLAGRAHAGWDDIVTHKDPGGWEFLSVKFSYDAGGGWRWVPEAEVWIFVVAPSGEIPVPAGFALIPAGSFQMGDSFSEGVTSERPVHTVFVSTFFMGLREVTKAQWDAVRAWAIGIGRGYTDLPEGLGKGPEHPVVSVSWHEAVKWLNAWSEMEGLDPVYRVGGVVMRSGTGTPVIDYAATGYRLPTEAEWEKAARGGASGRRFPWGDTISHSDANYISSTTYGYDVSPTRGNHPDWFVGDKPWSSPTGTFAANGYGLFDMTGNAMEWTGNWFASYTSSPLTDPTGPESGTIRVYRGGGWNSTTLACRTAARSSTAPVSRFDSLGFRAARTPAP